MALGGGTFIAQNKILPGAYINIVSASTASATLGDRGTVAIALPIGKAAGTVIELTRAEFVKDSEAIFGVKYSDDAVAPLREIFCHAVKVLVYDLGTDGTVSAAVAALEPYEFNVLCAYTSASEDIAQYITTIKSWRDDLGKKCQVVVHTHETTDYEGVINVISTIEGEDVDAHALVAWVAGAEAGCAVNQSCTNMLYDGEYTIVCDKTQTQLEDCITGGQLVFHKVYGDIRVLEDINSLTSTSAEKGEDFKSNQTIRVIDQIANDIAKLFVTKYLGKMPNNEANRGGLWADIVKHHRDLEKIEAIEAFESKDLIVAQGDTKKSVVVTDAVRPTNAMAQIYMTVVVQ